MILVVYKVIVSMFYEGIIMIEVEVFINDVYKKVGVVGNYFCIVFFGKVILFFYGVKDF